MVTPTFCISLNFFPKSLGIIDTEGKNNNNNSFILFFNDDRIVGLQILHHVAPKF